MNLLFDGSFLCRALTQNCYSGIFYVAKNLIWRLDKISLISLYVYILPSQKKLASQLKKSLGGLRFKFLSGNDDLSKINVFFSPCEVKPSFIDKCPWISSYTVLHDVIPLLYPKYFGDLNSWFGKLVEQLNSNDYYFSNSDWTKRDFLKYFPQINPDNIQTIPLSTNQKYSPNKDVLKLNEVKSKYNIPQGKKYLFSLCSLEPRKNLIRAVKSFIEFITKHNVDDLVYVLGGGAWAGFIEKFEKEVPEFKKYRNKIIRAGYVDDEDLEILYSNAEWFVYTSQYEGFGMPPLEAMACGCPVITSNNSSLPEVVGDAGIMINYDSDEQHVAAYEKYYYDEDFRKEMAQKGLVRSKLFSWDKAAEIIVNKMLEVERKKSSQPLVTIVTATYNLIEQGRKDWFIQNLESVKSQTYPNIEHIVIDGASTDGTLEILEEYQNKGWIKYYSEPDTGIYDAMNKGILKARGKYIVFLNSDDFYCEKHAVEWLVMKAEETDADAVCASANILKNERIVAPWSASNTKNLIFGDMACHQTFLTRVDVMKELGLFDLKYKTSSDTAFMYKMLNANKKFVMIDPVIVCFRLGGFSKDDGYVEIDVKDSLYEAYGQYHGLTPYDCNHLVRYRFLDLPIDKAIDLGTKLIHTKKPEWIKEYFAQLLRKHSKEKEIPRVNVSIPNIAFKKIYRLFGFLPLFKISRNEIKTNVHLLCFIPFLKIQKRSENDTRVYLFSFIPILRLKKTNRHEYANLFNVIPLWKVKS